MAKLKVFSILDTKADVFHTPFFFPATGQAVRAFKDLANDSSNMIGKHPGDFKLMHIGIFDDSNGSWESVKPVSLGFAEDFVEKPRIREVSNGN